MAGVGILLLAALLHPAVESCVALIPPKLDKPYNHTCGWQQTAAHCLTEITGLGTDTNDRSDGMLGDSLPVF